MSIAELRTTFRHGFLRGEAYRAQSASELISQRYDVLVVFSSWDSRCLSIVDSPHLSASHGICFFFDARDQLGLRDAHDPLILELVTERCDSMTIIKGESRCLDDLWCKLNDAIRDVQQRAARPIRILFDLSVCPRYLALCLLSASFETGIASQISFFYSEGQYPEEQSELDQHELFTAGGWSHVPVPYLNGKWDPSKRRFYLVSVGFEGSKTLRLVVRAEPDRVVVLLPDPGVRAEYVARTMANNAARFNRFAVDPDGFVRAEAANAIAAWQVLDDSHLEAPSEENAYYVCCGTKPHSLALGLRALVLKYPAVLYILPDRHKVVKILPAGIFWRFDIHDVTAVDPATPK